MYGGDEGSAWEKGKEGRMRGKRGRKGEREGGVFTSLIFFAAGEEVVWAAAAAASSCSFQSKWRARRATSPAPCRGVVRIGVGGYE